MTPETDTIETETGWELEMDDEVEMPRYQKPRKATKTKEEVVAQLTEPEDTTDVLPMTYKPARFEMGWLASSLGSFYKANHIIDVLSYVKGGKEASVYCCKAHPDLGIELLAAKVYRPRRLRNLRNDAMYREGRPILTSDGRAVKKSDHRILRAIGKKTDFGVQAAHTSWLMYEFTTLQALHEAGANVPRPYLSSENAILMDYAGELNNPAPALSQITLPSDETETLFAETLRNIRLLWEADFIHGDLSAYNILYWKGKITLIDFPQVTHRHNNPHAHFILKRDIQRVCDYFETQGVDCDADEIFREMWSEQGEVEGERVE
ncbi:MAG: hypothetical protein H7308_03355 [Chthonomonadaceae bacterium]|nr:hypothetical protein [Chthonomonadaceae bacterium]